MRNNVLNSRNYFDPVGPVGDFKQNQFGGTIGGPILHDKLFFFGDYQGNRKVFGQSTGAIPVPSDAERAGDFSAPALSSQLTGTVQGPYWAQQLGSALGYPVTPGEAYYVAGCTSGAQCVFPNAMIPSTVFPKPSVNILPYIPKFKSRSQRHSHLHQCGGCPVSARQQVRRSRGRKFTFRPVLCLLLL